MKHFYSFITALIFSATALAQQPIITAIVDGDCAGGNPKVIEIYASGTVDFSLYSVENQSNATTGTWGGTTTLTPLGIVTNGFVYLTTGGSAASLATDFPGITATNQLVTNTANNNGDDRVRIINTSTMAVIDQYGVSDTSGTGTAWVYSDSWAKRISGTGPEPVFNPANWTYGGANALDGIGVCFNGTITIQAAIGGIGTFSTTANTNPVVSITAPTNGASLNSGTTSTDLTWSAQNVPTGATFRVTVNGTVTNNATSPFAIAVQDGGTYAVTVAMVNGTTVVTSDTTNFTVAFPCALQVGTITTTCVTSTSGPDLYNITIAYTGGGTSMYTIDTAGNGTLGGDNPSTTAAGTITINGIPEGTNFTITFTGNPTNSSCNFTRSITGPTCVGNIVCANPGDIIITEIMKNPAAVGDNLGEYIEILNTTSAPINMQGWVLRDDATAAETHTISNLIVPANGYAVLGLSNDTTVNGGMTVNYVYNTVNLGNGSDGVAIECNGTLIDEVIYDSGAGALFPNGNGASMELALSALNATANDIGTNWGLATVAFGAGDLGTPGAVNTFTLSNNTFTLNNLKMYPNPLSNGILNITAGNGEAVDAVIYNVLGQQVGAYNNVTSAINLGNINTGMYLVKITQGTSVETRKLIVE